MSQPENCTQCDLPNPENPVTDPDVEGAFCCRGCLEAHRLLEPVDGPTDGDRSKAGFENAEPVGSEADGAAAETFLRVEGMHCSSCERFLETVAVRQSGVASAEASYASGLVRLRYDGESACESELADRLTGSGYRARPLGASADASADGDVPRLLLGGLFAMMTMVWYVLFLYPVYLDLGVELFADGGMTTTYLLANCWVMSSFVLGYTGFPILRGAWVSLRVGQPNMDLLVALAVLSAYFYSTVAIVLGFVEVYFDVVVAVIMVVSLGNYYQERMRRRAMGRLESLTREQAETARVVGPDGPEERPVEEVPAGAHLLLREGDRVPLDGRLLEGELVVDESLLTGESQPVTKRSGEALVAGSTVVANGGRLEVGEPPRSTVERLSRLVWASQSGRSGPQRLADRIASYFVPGALLAALVGGLVHAYMGAAPAESLLTALAVLIVACPCALGLATPLAMASGIREGLAGGMVVKDASIFERAPECDLIAVDKTGTLTTGAMELVDEGRDPESLDRAAALEQYAGHPVARAIERAARNRAPSVSASAPTGPPGAAEESVPSGETESASEVRVLDRGVEGRVGGDETLVGAPELFEERGWPIGEELQERVDGARAEGRLPVVVGWNGKARDVLLFGDRLRPEWEEVAAELGREAELILLTGDSEEAATPFRRSGLFDRVYAEVRPEGKRSLIRTLAREGTVAMVGDGTNDAPALAEADVGVGFGPTALAADSAHVVILREELGWIPEAFRLARAARRRIRQNLGWAFLYNAVAIPVALAGMLNPLVAAAAMSASSVLVVANSARRL